MSVLFNKFSNPNVLYGVGGCLAGAGMAAKFNMFSSTAKLESPPAPKVFFDITADSKPLGRIVFEVS